MQKSGAELRAEDQLSIYLSVKERFFANTISSEEQFLCSLIPNSECKHSAKIFWTIGTVLIIGMNDRFGIAVGVEGVAQLREFFAKLKVVVNLAVENDPGTAIVIVYRLLATFQVDDGETTHCQPD